MAIDASTAYSSNALGERRAVVRRRAERRVDQPGGAVDEALERVGPGGHLAQLVLDRAEAGDRLAELPALRRRTWPTSPMRRAAAAGAHRAQAEAAVVQRVQRDLVALADLAEHVVGRHPRVLQQDRRRRRAVQAHLVLFLAGADAGKRALDDERGELLAVDLREDDEQVGEAAVGDPHLLAVEHASCRRAASSRASSRASASDPEPDSLSA